MPPLKLYYHPLSSYCWKPLIALYEAGLPFEARQVDLMDPARRAAFMQVWPLGKFPVLAWGEPAEIIPESTIIIEALQRRIPSFPKLIPEDAEAALEVRFLDRFFDLHVQTPMNAITQNRLRPEGERQAEAEAAPRAALAAAYAVAEARIKGPLATGEAFTLADCAALPALFYADAYAPLAPAFPKLTAYLEVLKARPSIARVLAEAAPFMRFFPGARQT